MRINLSAPTLCLAQSLFEGHDFKKQALNSKGFCACFFQGYMTFRPMQFQPLQFQPLTISTVDNFNLLQFQPSAISTYTNFG